MTFSPTLVGSTGHYGRPLKAVVLGFGNTARGAITGLQALGVHDVTVLTMRNVTAVASPIPSVVIGHLDRTELDPTRTAVLTPEGIRVIGTDPPFVRVVRRSP